MFSRILIANRGEIACRIIRTVRRMGLYSIAVYSDADAGALHVETADEAHRLGPAPAADSYLSIERILRAVQQSGAEAIHPGYGFLSENPEFAEACAAAGLVFIGPSAKAISAMGSKIEAKRLATAAGVAVVPGYDGASQSPADLKAAADELGYPLMIKASAGGGGRGMRLVRDAGLFERALDSASREAKAAFGDGRVLLERYISRPRHVEVQVFGDSAGDVVHLFERDCSVQRRHQKIIEEAPAPGLDAATRTAMGEAAVAVTRSIGYVGAGTVEFILDCDRASAEDGFYFLEMNTRLQVEHPVTEMLTGQDLVEWQIRVAAGEPLPATQGRLRSEGHAIEVRLYAEDFRRDFLPSSGRLTHLRLPADGTAVRLDSGVREGDAVTPHYDPMMAKLIVSGETRTAALRRMADALRQTEVIGPATNRDFLAAIVAHPAFAKGDLDTGFVHRFRDELLKASTVPLETALILAAAAELLTEQADPQMEDGGADAHSPWRRRDGWRLFGGGEVILRFRDGSDSIVLAAVAVEGGHRLRLMESEFRVAAVVRPDGALHVEVGDRYIKGRVLRRGAERHILVAGQSRMLLLEDPDAPASVSEGGTGRLTAPLPATITAIHVQVEQAIKRGEALMVLEAMKMEHVISAPRDGTVAEIHYPVGAQVEEGATLMSLSDSGEGAA